MRIGFGKIKFCYDKGFAENTALKEPCRRSGKVQSVATVKLNKVNDDCSIANLPPGADIQVGDSICFELTDANAALKK